LEFPRRLDKSQLVNAWTIAAIAIVVPLVLRFMARAAAVPGTNGTLAYSVTLRRAALGLAIVPPILLGGLMLWHPPRGGDFGPLALVVLLFLLLASPLLLEFHRVRYTFDAQQIRVWSPWSRHRSLRWSDITTMRWRPALKWLDLSDGTTVLHVSPLLTGLDDFARQCIESSAEKVRARDPEVVAVLELMASGRGGELAFAPGRPSYLRG